MVTLNFTLFVQLLLFLLFLWGMQRFVFSKALKQLDDRDHYISQQESRAEVDRDLAQAQEERYAEALRDAMHNADKQFRDARRAALDELEEQTARQREQADRAVAIVREQAAKEALSERTAYHRLAPELAESIAKRIGLDMGKP